MKEKVSEQLEKYFFNLQYEDYDKPDQKLIQLLSLETEECEELYQKEPQLFDQYFKVAKANEPDTESEQEDNPNINAVKFEYSDSNEEMEAESSYMAANRGEIKKKKNYEFKMPVHNDEFGNAKNVLLLLEHKTDGIVQKFLRNNNWNEELHGLDLFDNLINVIYTTFLGLDYVSNKDFTINKKVDIARVSMTKLQLHDICLLDKYTCRYESYLYDIPQRCEYSQWISAYLMKIPIIGEICTERWKKEAIGEIQQTSLSYAKKIAKKKLTEYVKTGINNKKLKTISKDCCNILSDFKDFDIGRKTYTKKSIKNKNKKKYKSFWKKKKRRYSPGKYFKKSSKETPKKNTSYPQGKKKCRCWICNEEGHYANECPNRKKYPDKVKVLQAANNGGYEALEEEYDGIQRVFILHVDTNSSSSSEEDETTTDDSE
ncbi:unnamed protein product [Lactuca virosa]|uniref:CCHC-type domain-containing protein n=1 Tax=Lactuca virosa TaxID=75947 RepID=A0AAU9NWQ9_9ASTR|nr:unnamed protein product [Lactuca virosa]